ncbi:MAG TPA: SRPBCC family protein [Gammaproteobacteria bacterium]
MKKGMTFLISTGLGAAAMYFLDPDRGRYRRSKARDQLVHARHTASHGGGVVARDFRNRTQGAAARWRSFLNQEQPTDGVIAERVRASLGRIVSHPHAIQVEANDGVVTLSGPILRDEVPLLIDCALGVHGVRDVRNQLEPHNEAGQIPALQGGARPPASRITFLQSNWSPTARMIGGAGGALAAVCGFARRSFSGMLVGAAGTLLLARAATNVEMRRLLGVGMARRGIDIRKTIRINAPVEQVFDHWDNFENFPSFMKHVKQVRRIETGEGRERWRWTVTGPTGTDVEFDAVVTLREENRLIAWRTEEGALVQHSGGVEFQENPDGSTTVKVRMSYTPVAGAVGHAIAWILGADPKHQMNDDLLRMKSYLETGKIPHDAAEQRRGETPRTLQ